ncbi:unnamed protein product [Cylindrotheca closterium]|uniref:Uncharacterized protein n=1 Tax=Cylindrotheca closterium TaxID=2856 RepID=A0AAD2CXD6_9STRA|nr:unnamed protein product [Cylindrotheca closterium]
MAPGNRTAAPSMILRSSIPYSESSVSGRRKRNKWAEEEDAILLDTVRQESSGKINWPLVAHRVNQESGQEPRTGKQCRERWQNHLRPNIKKGNWTAQEEDMIRVLFDAYGPKWSSMSKLMKSRTDNDIKNKWYSMQRTEKSKKRKVAETMAIKRSLKTRSKERQEIIDLITVSKANRPPVDRAQDENQAIAANDTHVYDDLQPYSALYQGSFDTEDVSELLGLIATDSSEV